MRINRRTLLKSASALAAASPLAGWSQTLSKLTMQAAWVNDAEFMGYFIAMDNGYYKAELIRGPARSAPWKPSKTSSSRPWAG